MANQIAAFFRSQRGDASEKVAAHLRAYWSPDMRAELVAHLRAGGAGLDPVAFTAAQRLAGLSPSGATRTAPDPRGSPAG
ncbi:MAG: formate dehydrogenase subunit delta [Rhodobacteraceae bacterium]|nr:formate dehydrogenase subunit delta [Paracoccaceae bacterium]